MHPDKLRALISSVAKGNKTVEQAMSELKSLPYEDLGFAKLDHHRHLRRGFPEVVFCEGKTTEQIVAIVGAMVERESNVLATRVSPEDPARSGTSRIRTVAAPSDSAAKGLPRN